MVSDFVSVWELWLLFVDAAASGDSATIAQVRECFEERFGWDWEDFPAIAQEFKE